MTTKKEELKIEIKMFDNDTRVELSGVIPSNLIKEQKGKIIEHLSKNIKVDGFREGNVPESVTEKNLDSLKVWTDSAKETFMIHFPDFLFEVGHSPLGTPSLKFIKVPVDGDVSFSVSYALMPKVVFKKSVEEVIKTLNKKPNVPETTDADVAEAILNLRKSLFQKDNPQKEIPKDENLLPEITDEVIKEISVDCTDYDSFEKKVKESIGKERELQNNQIYKNKILDALCDNTDVEIPEIVLGQEEKNLFEEFKSNLKMYNLTLENYLKERKITEEELKKDLKETGRKRAITQLALNKIAGELKIEVDPNMVEKEVQRLKGKTDTSEDQLKVYISTILVNEKVIKHIESKINET